MTGREKKNGSFLHICFMHIFFEANESLKYSARLQGALLKADIFTHSGTLSLWMKSLYLAVEEGVCVCFLCKLSVYLKKRGELQEYKIRVHTW